MRPPFCNFTKFYGRRLGIFYDNDTNPHPVSGPFLWTNGMQRLLDARGQRGSWMPSKIFSIHPAKFQTTFFISCQISGQFTPWMPPPVLHHAPVTTFFSSFFVIYLHFFT